MVNLEGLGFFEREKVLVEEICQRIANLPLLDLKADNLVLPCDKELFGDLGPLTSSPASYKAVLGMGISELSRRKLPRPYVRQSGLKNYLDLYLEVAQESRQMLAPPLLSSLSDIRYLLDQLANPLANPHMGRGFGWLNSMLNEKESGLFGEIITNVLSAALTRSRQGDIKFSLLTLPLQAMVLSSNPNFEWFRYPNGFGLRRNPWSVIAVWDNVIERAITEGKDPLEASVGFFRERR